MVEGLQGNKVQGLGPWAESIPLGQQHLRSCDLSEKQRTGKHQNS